MSSVRMCDQCGEIFSENTGGWQSFTGSTIVEKDDGEKVTRSQSLDLCSNCAVGTAKRGLLSRGKKD